jgi:hypothetical protein
MQAILKLNLSDEIAIRNQAFKILFQHPAKKV